MIIHRTDSGDTVEQNGRALIVRFGGRRRVLSTSALNGGVRDDLEAAFNHDCKEDGRKDAPLKGATYEEHLKLIAAELGLDHTLSTGLTTAADMENVSVVTETYENVAVTAVVTGGIDVNGGRVGDPAPWHESDGVSVPASDKPVTRGTPPPSGTINILLFIGARLPEGTLARALVTCTEAKTAALQELLAPSCYSSGIATGSGTDGTIIVSELTSPLLLTYAGKHAKLGELIGLSVKKAVREALYRQTGLGPAQQLDVFARLGRYGLTRASILEERPETESAKIETLAKGPGLVVMASLYVHLLDQLSWGLLAPRDAAPAANRLLADMGMDVRISAVHDSAKAAIGEIAAAFRKGFIKKLSQ